MSTASSPSKSFTYFVHLPGSNGAALHGGVPDELFDLVLEQGFVVKSPSTIISQTDGGYDLPLNYAINRRTGMAYRVVHARDARHVLFSDAAATTTPIAMSAGAGSPLPVRKDVSLDARVVTVSNDTSLSLIHI